MRLLHNAVDFSLPCFPVYPIRGLTGILLLISNTAQLGVTLIREGSNGGCMAKSAALILFWRRNKR